MPNKRRRGQCLDFAVGGLKKLAYDEKVSPAVRLESIKLMLKLDGVYPTDETSSLTPPEVVVASEDRVLEALRAKHGGVNETT